MNGEAEDRRRYEDFELWVDHATSSPYMVRVVNSLKGPATGQLNLDVKDEDFQFEVEQVAAINPGEDKLKAFGKKLFDALFSGDVRTRWVESLAIVDEKPEVYGLRLLLRIDAPQVAALPWELLYQDPRFLAADGNRSVCRYLPVREPPVPKPHEELRVLLVVESPETHNLDPIEDKEVELIDKAIHKLAAEGRNVSLTVLRNAHDKEIKEALLEDYHVLHFLGHGKGGILYLVAEDRKTAQPTDDRDFARLFEGRHGLRLVVLSACSSGQKNQMDVFGGVGPALVKSGRPAVIAMQYPSVQVETAGLFSEGLYGALAKGYPADVAVNEGRNLVASRFRDERDWSTPVLYIGTRNGRILYLSESDVVQEAARESPLAAAALAELGQESRQVAFRSNRVNEWLAFEMRIQDLKSKLDKLQGKVQKTLASAARSPENFYEAVENMRETWDDECHVALSEFRSLGRGIEYLDKPLADHDGSALDVGKWFKEVDDLGKAVEDLLEESLFVDLDQQVEVRNLLRKLQAQCRKLGRLVVNHRASSQDRFQHELKALSERATRLHAQFEV